MLNKIIIGILSCQKNIERQKAIRETWLKNLDKNKYFPIFIIGNKIQSEEFKLIDDILYVKSPDDYDHCVGKIKKYYQWIESLSSNQHSWLLDDDIYINCNIFNNYIIDESDYLGNFIYGYEYTKDGGGRTSGCATCLSKRAAKSCAMCLPEYGVHGDVGIGNVLNQQINYKIIKKHEDSIYPWSYCRYIDRLMIGHYIDKGEGSMPTFYQSMDKMHRMYTGIGLRTIIAFKTHIQNEIFIKNLCQIKKDIESLKNFELVILNHENDNNPKMIEYYDIKIINFNNNTKICKKQNYNFWYRADVPLIHLYELMPNYDFYYQVEYDCHMDNWKDLFLGLQNDNSDLLASWLKDQDKEPNWQWWSAQNIFMGKSKLLGIYFPIVRLSNKGCSTLRYYYEYNQELDGFCEILVPSLMNRQLLKISDIGNILGYIKISHKDEDLLRYMI